MDKLEALYNQNRRRYVNTMSRILRGDYAAAEDVVQEAFTRAIKFHKAFDEKRGPLHKWFNTILYNSLRDVQREMHGRSCEEPGEMFFDEDFFDLNISKSPEKKEFLRDMIAIQKNDKHRRVLELFFFSGYTSTEISQIEEKVSVSNVTTIISRFRDEFLGE